MPTSIAGASLLSTKSAGVVGADETNGFEEAITLLLCVSPTDLWTILLVPVPLLKTRLFLASWPLPSLALTQAMPLPSFPL